MSRLELIGGGSKNRLIGGDIGSAIMGKLPVIVPVYLRKLLQSDRGNMPIAQIWVVRTPVQQQYRWLMSLLSGGEIDKQMAKLGYTNLFHLYMVMKLADGTFVKVEKDQRIKFTKGGLTSEDMIGPFPGKSSLRVFFQKAADFTGGWSNIAGYDPRTNSCQTFARSVLLANGYYTYAVRRFVEQNLKDVLKTSPLTSALISKVISVVGNLEFIADEVIETVQTLSGQV
jgi:hypothetical protein